MIPFRKTIGFRLLIVVLIVLALPLLVDSFVLVQKSYRQSILRAKGDLIEEVRLRELPLTQMQPVSGALLRMISHFLKFDVDFPTKDSPELNQKLEKIAEVGGFFGAFVLKITEEGQYIVVASSKTQYIGRNYTDFFKLAHISRAMIERGYINYVAYDPQTGEPFDLVARLIFKGGKPIGVLALSQNIGKKLELFLKPEEGKFRINFAMLLPSTIVYAASDPSFRFQYFAPLETTHRDLFLEDDPIAKGLLPDKPITMDEGVTFPFIEFTWKGEKQVAYVRRLPGSFFSLMAYASKKEIFKAPVRSYMNVYLAYGLILVIGSVISYLLIRTFARSMRALSGVMQKIEKGDLQARYKKDRFGFEINELGMIFNEMVDDLIANKKRAEEERVAKETMAAELQLGQSVQRSLLPEKLPQMEGIELAQNYSPAIEVGGDFFDAFVKEDGQTLVLSVADASGKGVRACFYSLSVRNMLRTYAQSIEQCSQVAEKTNHLFYDEVGDSGMFVTLLLAFYEKSSRKLHYISCGHNPAFLMRPNGNIEKLDHMQAAVGFLEEQKGEGHVAQLEVGDVVVFYTDGVTEAHNENRELYGEERLEKLLKTISGLSAQGIVDLIMEDLARFSGEAPQHDDITLLVMKVAS